MSHRVTTKTEIKNKALAISALKASGCDFREEGNNISISSGPLRGATLNLTTGVIGGDWNSGLRQGNDSIGFLKRFYAEATIMEEFALQGIAVEQRVVEKDGRIRLICQGSFSGN